MYSEVQEARELILSTLADWTIEFPGNIVAMSLKVNNETDVRLERGFNKLKGEEKVKLCICMHH